MRAYKKNKLKRIFVTVVLPVVVTTILVFLFSAYLEISNYEKKIQEDIKSSKKEFLSIQTENIKKQVEHVNSTIISKISNTKGLSSKIEEKLKQNILDNIESLRIYPSLPLAIIDLHNINGGKDFATVLYNSANKTMEGKKISDDFKDKNGFAFRKEYLKDLRINGFSYIPHIYQNYSYNEQKDTDVYLYLQKDWNWIILSSFYLNDLTKQIQTLENQLLEHKANAIYDAIVSIVLSLISLLLVSSILYITLKKK